MVVEIVSLLKKIYKRDAPFRAVLKVKTLVALFPPYAREMKTNTAKFNLTARRALQTLFLQTTFFSIFFFSHITWHSNHRM